MFLMKNNSNYYKIITLFFLCCVTCDFAKVIEVEGKEAINRDCPEWPKTGSLCCSPGENTLYHVPVDSSLVTKIVSFVFNSS